MHCADSTDILLRCLACPDDPQTAEMLARLSEPPWQEVLALASHQEVSGLLWRCVSGLDLVGRVPDSVSESLRKEHMRVTGRNMQLLHGLGRLLALLAGESVPILVLKGAYLVEHAYGDLGCRAMRDIDLLVAAEHVDRVERALGELDYEIIDRYRENREMYLRTGNHFTYSDRRGTIIEVHWRLEGADEPLQSDIAGIWQRARPARGAGADVLAMSGEDLLVHLCTHACYHHRMEMGLKSLCDLRFALVAEAPALDWDRVVDIAVQAAAVDFVYATLALAARTVGANVPEDALARLASGRVDESVLAELQSRVLGRPVSRESLLMATRQAASAGRAREKIAAGLRTVFPTPSVMRRKHGLRERSWMVWWYYIPQALGLLGRVASECAKLLGRTQGGRVMADREDLSARMAGWLAAARSDASRPGPADKA